MDIKALRQKILDLAIRGKLVPQDPNDEPASVLLERIREQKKQMVKEGKLKPKDIKNDTVIFKGDDNLHYEKFSDGTVKCIEDEIPFDVPNNWEWVRLGTICPYGDNKAISPDLINESSWILDLEDIEKDTGIIKHYATKLERNSVSNKYAFTSGQLLYSKLRPYLNKVVIAKKDGYCTTEILPLMFYGNISAQYIQMFIMSPTFLAYVNMISYGVKMPRLGTTDGKNAIIAIPPINEQLRIRKQFDAIVTLLSKIERYSKSLHNNVSAAKSKILNLAIRGRLVPQDPNDEPASVLLERIRAEKEELIKQGKIKRDKKESVIFKGEDNSYYEKIGNSVTCIDDELPFEIPNNWAWSRLQSICEPITDGTHQTPIYSDSGYIFLSAKNVTTGSIDWNNVMYIPDSLHNELYSRIAPRKGDILLAKNGTTGVAAIVDRDCEFDIYVTLALIRTVNHLISPHYLLKAIGSTTVQSFFKGALIGIGVPNLHLIQIRQALIPIPPLAEQVRLANETKKIFDILSNIEKSLS